MVVHIHSLGSLWQVKETPSGLAVWNTTGVMVNGRLRSRAITFGQVSFGRIARVDYARGGSGPRGIWHANITSRGDGRFMKLVSRSPRLSVPEYSLVCATSGIIGRFTAGDIDQQSSEVVSLSSYRDSVEALLLMRPYSWVRGTHGSLTLLPHGLSFNLRLARWD